jgi:SlyX protein
MKTDRIVALEELTAHQAKVIDELSGEIARQWEVIRALERRLDAMSERFATLEDAAAAPPESRRPPHW